MFGSRAYHYAERADSKDTTLFLNQVDHGSAMFDDESNLGYLSRLVGLAIGRMLALPNNPPFNTYLIQHVTHGN